MGCTGCSARQSGLKTKNASSMKSLDGCNTEITTLKGQSPQLAISFVASSMPGWRSSNEDAFLVSFPVQNIAVFGIFDGHSGSEISLFAKLNFVKILENTQSFKQRIYDRALTEAFITLDRLLVSKNGLKLMNEVQELIAKSKQPTNGSEAPYLAGCTASVMLMTRQQIFIANAGDSRSIIVKNNRIIKQTEDHRADNPKEAQRIANCGGQIQGGRIFGDLNVSRGFGDFQYKTGKTKNHIVSVMPDIYITNRQDADFILMGSDGIWQRSSQSIWQSVSNILSQKQCNQRNVIQGMQQTVNSCLCSNLATSKYQIHGVDNMTAILIKIGKQGIFSNASTTVL